MEANEVQELKEHAEHSAHEETMRPVAFTMAVLAVLVAIATVLGHRTHTEAVLNQNRATDAWNFYQAHKIRANDTELAADLLGVVAINDKDGAAKIAKAYADHQKKWASDLDEEQKEASALEGEVKLDERRGGTLRPVGGAAGDRPCDHVDHLADAQADLLVSGPRVFDFRHCVRAISVPAEIEKDHPRRRNSVGTRSSCSIGCDASLAFICDVVRRNTENTTTAMPANSSATGRS
jgi:hypothetical protein